MFARVVVQGVEKAQLARCCSLLVRGGWCRSARRFVLRDRRGSVVVLRHPRGTKSLSTTFGMVVASNVRADSGEEKERPTTH